MSKRTDGKIPVQILVTEDELKRLEKHIAEVSPNRRGGVATVVKDFALKYLDQLSAPRRNPQKA